MKLCEKLKELRIQAGMGQEELAEKLGVSRQSVSAWENGRASPDIANLIKLSDLYGISLDELLREEGFRRQVARAAVVTSRNWNLLFELAILLLPFGNLVGYWGFAIAGFIMRLVGVLMLPVLWYTRWKLYGGDKEEMKKSLTGWGLYVASQFVQFVPGLVIPANLMSIVGLLMIYAYGVHMEKSPRFWLVIALYVGIPIYIYGSAFLNFFNSVGAFSPVDPFGHEYRIAQVQYGPEAETIVELTPQLSGNGLSLNGERIGYFTYVKPSESQTEQGIWQLVPENSPEELYKLVVDENGDVILSYFVDDQLQNRWELEIVDVMQFEYITDGSTVISEPDWYYADSFAGDPQELATFGMQDGQNLIIHCTDETLTELTLVEEYYHNGQLETHEYVLSREKDVFTVSIGARYAEGEQYAIYRIAYQGGEFLEGVRYDK